MNPADALSTRSYEQALAVSAALFLDLLKGARADQEKAAIADHRPGSRSQALPKRLRRCLEQRGSLTPREMRALIGCSSMTLTRGLRVLLASGEVESEGHTRNVTYRLTKPSTPRRDQPDLMPTPMETEPTNQPRTRCQECQKVDVL